MKIEMNLNQSNYYYYEYNKTFANLLLFYCLLLTKNQE